MLMLRISMMLLCLRGFIIITPPVFYATGYDARYYDYHSYAAAATTV
jgi:hypothetical protein